MKTMNKMKAALVVAALAASLSAQATVNLTYTIANDTTVQVGNDSVTLTAFSSPISLEVGTPKLAKVNGVVWDYVFDNTSYTESKPFSRDISISLAAGGQTITQTGTLQVTYTGDYDSKQLSFSLANPVSFTFNDGGQWYNLTISQNVPTVITTSPIVSSGVATADMLENFSLTAVPEPSTIVAGALLLLPFGVSSIRVLRKNRN